MANPNRFESDVVTLRGRSMPYVTWLPPGYSPDRKWPVLVFLHGAGERGSDGLSQTRVGIGPALQKAPERFPFLVIMPQCPRGAYWDVLEDHVLEALKRTTRAYQGDPARTYLTGISMGGYGTWAIGSLHAELFAALVPICGGGDPEAMTPSLRKVPVWAFHGAMDEIVPVEESRIMVAAIRSAGNSGLRYSEYPKGGHNVWDAAYAEADLPSWLLSFAK